MIGDFFSTMGAFSVIMSNVGGRNCYKSLKLAGNRIALKRKKEQHRGAHGAHLWNNLAQGYRALELSSEGIVAYTITDDDYLAVDDRLDNALIDAEILHAGWGIDDLNR